MPGRPYPTHQRTPGTVFYGFDAADDSVIEPMNAITPRDDVTGAAILPDNLVFQDGMVKDGRLEAGSIENEWRHTAGVFFFVLYDPSRGVQQHPAGYYDD
jgi:hypothetical protein